MSKNGPVEDVAQDSWADVLTTAKGELRLVHVHRSILNSEALTGFIVQA